MNAQGNACGWRLRRCCATSARSLLTMLGIVIGVAAVIVTVAIGVGRAYVGAATASTAWASNLIVVLPGSVTQTGARSGSGGASTLTPDDGMAHRRSFPASRRSRRSVTVRTQVVAGGNNWQTTVTGVAPTYTYIRSWPRRRRHASSTRPTSRRRRRSPCSGKPSSPSSFPTAIPDRPDRHHQGRAVHGRSARSRRSVRAASGQDQDDTVLIPYTSAMQRLTGLTTVNTLMVSADDADAHRRGADRASRTLLEAAPPDRSAADRTTSKCATCRSSRSAAVADGHRSWSCCSPASRPSRWSSAASAS